MEEFRFTSPAYGESLLQLMERVMNEHGLSNRRRIIDYLYVDIHEGMLHELVLAAAETIIVDLRPFEMERLIKLMPLTERERLEVLPRAVRASYRRSDLIEAYDCVGDYFTTERQMNIEGFLRFRMPFMLERWARAADIAGMELIFRG